MLGGPTHSDRGLTPVVGIVLLIAITLLLASTVAAFALGFGDENNSRRVPTTALNMEYDADSGGNVLTIVHQSGQMLDLDRTAIDIEGASCTGGADPNGQFDATNWMTGELSSGETIVVDGSTAVCTSGTLDLRSATVRVIWRSETGTSSMLREWTGPG